MLIAPPVRDTAPPSGLALGDLRAREFSRLDASGEAYLDFTGAALYPESLVRAHAERLERTVFGNPHSESPASRRSTAAHAAARRAILGFLDADEAEYDACLTSNASNALRLVGESFPFAAGSRFLLAADNHNSVNGIRELAAAKGADVRYLALDDELRLDRPEDALDAPRAPSLLAYPAQSNFSGVRHPLALARQARSLGWRVLLDAAAFVPTRRLSLREHPADFVALSLYKVTGYPTGVGALVARREALAELRRPWFAGGTVDFVSVQNRLHQLRPGADAFEDGTPDFLALDAVPDALAWVEQVGLDRIGRHVVALTARLLGALAALHHSNGRPVVQVYGPATVRDRGGTVAFNVLDRAGRALPYETIVEGALLARISIRGGCFCNPGAGERAFDFPAAQAARCLEQARRHGFDPRRFSACMDGRPAGALRASFGAPTVGRDLDRLVALLASWRDCTLD